jgi:hypothetical protein
MRRLALCILIASGVAACENTSTEPASNSTIAKPASTPQALQACPTTSPKTQIALILARVNSSNLPATVKAKITAALQRALTALNNRNLTGATSAIQSAIATLEASRAPQPVKTEIVRRLNCVLARLSA